MAIDDVYIITVSAIQLGNLRQNSLAFKNTDGAAASAASFLAIANSIKEIHRVQQDDSVTYTTYRARQIAGSGVTWPTTGSVCTPTGGLLFEGVLTGTLVGGHVPGDTLPSQCAMVTTLRTAQVGRSHRGRLYAFGWNEENQAAGVWDPALITSITAAWDSFFTTYAVATPVSGYRLGVWSTVIASGCKTLSDGTHVRFGDAHPEQAFTPLTGHITRATVFTQRRRVLGVGL